MIKNALLKSLKELGLTKENKYWKYILFVNITLIGLSIFCILYQIRFISSKILNPTYLSLTKLTDYIVPIQSHIDIINSYMKIFLVNNILFEIFYILFPILFMMILVLIRFITELVRIKFNLKEKEHKDQFFLKSIFLVFITTILSFFLNLFVFYNNISLYKKNIIPQMEYIQSQGDFSALLCSFNPTCFKQFNLAPTDKDKSQVLGIYQLTNTMKRVYKNESNIVESDVLISTSLITKGRKKDILIPKGSLIVFGGIDNENRIKLIGVITPDHKNINYIDILTNSESRLSYFMSLKESDLNDFNNKILFKKRN